MDVLNQDFDFQRDASPDEKEAFWTPPQKFLLLPKVQLYRLVTLADVNRGFRGNELFRSPWWYPRETFRELSRMAQSLNLPLPEVARTHLAVREAWNPLMDYLCIIELTKPAWVWRGPIRYQPQDDERRIFYMGGLDQVYLPNLDGASEDTGSNRSDYAFIVHFGRVSDV